MVGQFGIAVISYIASMLNVSSEATLLFVGDAMQHKAQLEVAHRGGNRYDYSTCYDRIAPLISQADYAVVNLETPVAGGNYSGYPMFNAPDTYVTALKDAGFDLFLTANNHTLDRHDRGLRTTCALLDSMGVDHIGTYNNARQRAERIPFVKDINGFKVGFLNYTYGTNGIDIQGDVVVDYINRKQMQQDIADVRQAGAELVCVAVHWGEEYKLLPNSHQKSLATFLLDQGVDMVIGGHPHVIQPMEMRMARNGDRQLLVYSLGNFISGMRTRDTRGGALVRVHLRRTPEGRAVIDAADYDLVFTVPGQKGADNYHLVFADSCDNIPRRADCVAFRNAATEIFDKHNIDVPHRQ